MKKLIEADQFIDQIGGQLPVDLIAPSDHTYSAKVRAAAILSLFGGLHVGSTGAGQDLAKSDVHFFRRLVPDEGSLVAQWKSQLGELTGIGTAHNDHMTIFG